MELVLKPSCCGKYDSSVYVAGVHFTVDDIKTFGINKKIKGRALWAMGLSVLRSIMKALAIFPKLLPRVVIIDKNCAVVGYASGKNESSFLQHIDDGMYAVMTKEGSSLLCEDTSDDDYEILGVTSEEGMPMMRDDGMSIDSSSENVVVVDVDPFGGCAAPQGYTYIGKLVFICFGPSSKYFTSTLAMGGQSKHSAEEKKEGSMRAIRKITKAQNDIDREIGMDRGMSMQARMQCAFMAQNEDDAIQRHRDMRMVMLTKQIESTERLIELKIKMSDKWWRIGGD